MFVFNSFISKLDPGVIRSFIRSTAGQRVLEMQVKLAHQAHAQIEMDMFEL